VDCKETYPFTNEELEHYRAGHRITPYVFTHLCSEMRADCRRVLEKLSRNLKSPGSIDWLNKPLTREVFQSRFSKTLDNLVSDISWGAENAETISASFGISQFLDLATEAVLGSAGNDIFDPDCLATAANNILSSVAALQLLGRVSEGVQIARLADTLEMIGDTASLQKSESFKHGKSKSMGSYTSRIRMLQILNSYLGRNEIPTKKLLYADMRMEASQASPIVKASGLQKLLPDAKWKSNEFRSRDLYRVPNHDELLSSDTFKLGPVSKEDGVFPPAPIGSNYADRDIRLLRKKLGPAYSCFLLMFGMDQLEDRPDLERFEARLKERGVALDWKTIVR
jgi:hypothetical protein